MKLIANLSRFHPKFSKPKDVLSAFFAVALILSITACDNDTELGFTTTTKETVPTLTDQNINAFTQKFATDYFSNLDGLLINFHAAYGSDDEYQFINYRNQKWTPAYIKEKHYYATVFEQNKAYLDKSVITPMFNCFENLIYIGLDLKKGLLNKDPELIEQTIVEANADKKLVNSIITSVGLAPRR